MAGRRIGEVFVAIEADTSMFRASAYAGLKKSLAGIEGNIPVTADTKEARAQVAALKARMTDLSRQLSEIKIGANGKPAEAEIRRIQLRLKDLADVVAHITMKADTSQLDAAIAKEELNLAKLNEDASTLKMDADDKALKAKIAGLEYQAEVLQSRLKDLDPEIDGKQILAIITKIRAIKAQVEVLNAEAHNIVLDADASRLLAAIGRSEAVIKQLKAEAEDLKIGGKTDLAALSAAELQLLGLESATRKLNPDLKVMNDRLIQGFRGFGRFGIGVLTARVALFGGLSAVSGWHIALDAIIEGLAVIVPALTVAAAGLGAFALAGSDAFRQVYQRLLNIHTVSDAFGVTIGPMTGKLEKLHEVVRPQVWQLYGDAIAIAHDKTGLFNKLAVDTGSVIDKFAARLTVLATSAGPGLDKFIKSGTRDLQQFGRIFLNLGDAFGKLIQVTEQTHIAEALLAIVNAGAKLIDLFTKIPLPILATVIAIHGIYLWSGLAASALVALLRPFGRLAAAAAGAKLAGSAVQDLANAGGGTRFARLGAVFADLATNLKALPSRAKAAAIWLGKFLTSPWGLVTVGVVALVGLGIWLSRTKSRAQELVGSIEKLVSTATTMTVINVIGKGLVKTNTALAVAQKDLNNRLKEGTFLAPAMAARFGPLGSGAQEAADRVAALTGEHDKLTGQISRVTPRLADIAHAYGTDGLAGAMALATLAGVKVDQLLSGDKTVWAAALQQIDGVVQGYHNMGQGATQLANDINVLAIAQSDQLKNMQTLNSAFDQFTQILSGPVDSFLALANTLKRFSKDAGVTGAAMSGLGTGITGVSKKATDAALQLQSDFQDTFKAATQMADAMRLTGTASEKQVAAIKDVVQVLVPMAGHNKAAAAEISALAQEAGGPATTNLKELAKWAGKTKDPLGAAQKAAQDAAVGFSNMSLDAQKLGTTLSQDLTKDMATAVENAVGLQGAMNAFAKDLQSAQDTTSKGHRDRAQLYADLASVGITGKQADAIIQALTDRLAGHRKALEASQKARALYNTDLLAVLNKAPNATRDVQDLADAVKNHGTKSDAARNARQKLIDDLKSSGVQADTAKRLVNNLQTAISGMHGKTVKVGVNFVGSGTGQIAFKESVPGVTLGPGSQGLLGFHAEGGMISGGQRGKDSVLGMLMPGEVVVPTKMVQEGAVDHLRGLLPGFAAGGAVGNIVQHGNAIAASGVRYMADKETRFGQRAERHFAEMAIAKFKKDMAMQQSQLAGAGIRSTALGGDQGANRALARTMFPWPASMWPSYVALEMQEAGFNRFARNPSSGAYGIPQALPPTKMPFAAQAAGGSHAGPQIAWMYNYISGRYGNPVNAESHELAYHWYGKGGMVPPGYATGGSVTDPGGAKAITALRKKLWSLRHHEGEDYLGLLHAFQRGPAKYRTKLTMQELGTLARRQGATQKAYTALTGAGLTVKHLNALGAAARAEARTAGDKYLSRLPGGHPGWAHGLVYWLTQLSNQTKKGLPGGQQTTGPGGVGLPQITHTYGGDVGDTIGAFLSSVASPFGMAAGGRVFDRGGWLKPGWNAAYNGTGRAEHLVPSDQEITVHIDVTGANSDAEKFLATMIKKYVKVRGGNVQKAYGAH